MAEPLTPRQRKHVDDMARLGADVMRSLSWRLTFACAFAATLIVTWLTHWWAVNPWWVNGAAALMVAVFGYWAVDALRVVSGVAVLKRVASEPLTTKERP